MAQERNLATARALDTQADDTDPTKEELQRRMEEARESITQTVSDIKDTVSTQYQNVRETISQTLDWREQYRRRPVAFTIGATAAGVIVGYNVAGLFIGEPDLAERYYEAEGEGYEEEERAPGTQTRAGGARMASAYSSPAASTTESAPASRPSYSSGYEAQTAAPQEEEADKPGLLERFKETQAYDRLQDELGKLGSRAVEELSKTAQTVVLPLLLNKLKQMIGLDLASSGTPARRTQQTTQAGGTSAPPNPTGGGSS